MPNNKQAKKRLEQDDRHRLHNKTIRSSMRSAMKRVLSASSKDEADAALPLAMKRIDKAAKTNIIRDNAAARYKSRLAHAASAK